MILGNPPWLKLSWEEKGILGDKNPLFVVRKLSAPRVKELRDSTFIKYKDMKEVYFSEYSECDGTLNFLTSTQNYPELNKIQTNLYKCFLPLGWRIANRNGVSGFLHPEGIYDDPKGAEFRGKIFSRLRRHFQFSNGLMLFSEVHDQLRFSINIYGGMKPEVGFYNICNLLTPKTVDLCFEKPSTDIIPIKNNLGKWNFDGNSSRVLFVDDKVMKLFGAIFEDAGTDALQSKLPNVHSEQLFGVLTKLSDSNTKLIDIDDEYISTRMWDETNAQKEGILSRNTHFPESLSGLVIAGPYINIGNPFNSTPRAICNHNQAYDRLDLLSMPYSYIPRSNYKIVAAREKALSGESKDSQSFTTDYYRLAVRAMLNPSQERTLYNSIVPPEVKHINGVRTYMFFNEKTLLKFSSFCHSILFDYRCKLTAKTNLHQMLDSFPYVEKSVFLDEMVLRTLCLNSVTSHYRKLWERNFKDTYKNCKWAKSDSRLLNKFFECLDISHSRESSLRTDFARRQALVEIDVLAAMALNLNLEELLNLYLIQFPVLQQNENDTWYDNSGRIVFTSSKGLLGTGLDRKYNKSNDFNVGIKGGVFVAGSEQILKLNFGTEDNPWNEENGQIGWEDIKDLKSGIVTKTYMDDTVPDGPVERTIEYHAPFDRCDREEDYRVVWAEFERRFGKTKE